MQCGDCEAFYNKYYEPFKRKDDTLKDHQGVCATNNGRLC